MSNPISLLFTAGGYGTFIEWAMLYFAGYVNEELPFNDCGNSHKYKGVHLGNMANWRLFMQHKSNVPIVRFHPKTNQSESLLENVAEVAATTKCVFLHIPQSLFALTINNKFEKTYTEGWVNNKELEFIKNLQQWKPEVAHAAELDPWELREFLSFYIWQQHLSESGSATVDSINDPNVLVVNIQRIFDSFENTIRSIMHFANLPIVRTDFNRIYREFITRQQHYGKDQLINDIVNQKVSQWLDLTIADEALIQMHLRNNGTEIRCFGVNEFPTTQSGLIALFD